MNNDQINWINRLKVDQDDLTAMVRDKDDEIGKLTKRVSEVTAWNAKLNEDVANLERLLNDRDVERKRLNGVVDQYKKHQDNLSGANSKLSDIIDAHADKNAQLREEITELVSVND
jgi:uncharacterized phage infection (PIP) family protein YhgE